MDQPYQERHGPFLLRCAPVRDVQGRWLPRLVATRIERQGSEDFAVALPACEPFDEPSQAAEFALNVGKRWVRERLLSPGNGPR